MLLEQILSVFLAFFAIMNPISNSAIFSSLVGNESKEKQIKIAKKALIITFSIILVFSIFGKTIFHLFDITLPALRITGGILIFIIGYHMLNGSNSSLHTNQNNDASDIAVSPLAVPLLAGPGTIATAMNYSATGRWSDIFITIIVFGILCIITYYAFINSSKIFELLGKNGLNIITRLMGLILAVIGTQMIISGIITAFNFM